MKDPGYEKLIRQGKWDEAIGAYEKALRKKPRDEYLLRKLGDLYERAGRREEAIKTFLRLGNYYASNEFYKKAIAIYKKIYQLDPSKVDYGITLAGLYAQVGLMVNAKNLYLHLAEMMTKRKRNREAIKIYEKLAILYPEDFGLKEILINLYLSEGMKEEGVKLLLEISKYLYDRGNTEGAFSRVKRAITLQPDNEEALEMAKKLSELSGSDLFEKLALEAFRKSQSPKIKFLLADYYLSIQNMEKAREFFEELIKKEPENEKLQAKLAEIYLFMGDYDKGYSILSSLAEKKIGEEDYEEALELLNSLLKVNPTHEKTLERVAEIYEKTGKKNSLIGVLSALAEIYENRGEEEKLLGTLRKLLSLDPDNVAFQEWYTRLVGGEEEESGEEFIRTHLEEAENYTKLELWSKAEGEIEEILAKYPEHWDSKLKLLEIHLRKGDVKGTKKLADSLRMEALSSPQKLKELENLLSAFMKGKEGTDEGEAPEELMELEEELLEEEEEMVSGEGSETMFDLSFAEKEKLSEREKEKEEEEAQIDLSDIEEIGLSEEEPEPEAGEVELEELKTEEQTPGTEAKGSTKTQREVFNPKEAFKEVSKGPKKKEEEVDLSQFGVDLDSLLPEFPEKKSKAGEKGKGEEREEGVFDLGKAITQELDAMDEIQEGEKKQTETEMIKKWSEGMSSSIEKEDYQTHFDLGIAYMEMDMYDDAIAEFQISSKGKEKKLESLELMGICLLEKGLYEEAIEVFDKGLKEKGYPEEKYLGLKYNLAMVFSELGNKKKSKHLLEEIKKVDPSYLDGIKKAKEILK